MLYVAITRARKHIIIYDEQPAARANLSKMWEEAALVRNITRASLEKESLSEKASKDIKIFQSSSKKTDEKGWKKQGIIMYKRGHF